ncbi:MAG: hypothetical protein P1V51_11345 [Deltaproteobacteria bacterium]|nr:hypothetical protein [Deltaproteobacteria bacterium]
MTRENDPTLLPTWAAVEMEHEHMYTLFSNLEEAEERDEALEALGQLETWLQRHFAQEEKPGGFLERICTGPGEADALREEHRSLLVLIERTRDVVADVTAPWNEVAQKIMGDIGSGLRAHENRERTLAHRRLGLS